MRHFAALSLALPALLAACELTPRQECEWPHQRELRVVREEIKQVETNLDRGFRLVPTQSTTGLHYCIDHWGDPELCDAEDGRPMFDRRPISRAAEEAKFQALIAERARLMQALNQCAAQFPE